MQMVEVRRTVVFHFYTLVCFVMKERWVSSVMPNKSEGNFIW